ncbi:hypothetical protein MTO96_042674, partial [Rhipicephalus appendiculatus]
MTCVSADRASASRAYEPGDDPNQPGGAGALEGADDSGSAETDAEQTAGRGLEASSAESSRESWPVSQTESDEQEVPKTEGPPYSDTHAVSRDDDENFPPLPPSTSRVAHS